MGKKLSTYVAWLVAGACIVLLLRHWITTTLYVDDANEPLSIWGTPVFDTGASGGSVVVTSHAGFLGLGTVSGYSAAGPYFALTLPTLLLLLLAFAPLYLHLWRARHPERNTRL